MPSARDNASSSDGGASDEENPVESLVSGRVKRATAGNRMASLLDNQGDDDLELLFAEDDEEEDIEFEGDDTENVSDAELESSSDDEDQGPAKGGDDLEGEKELQRQIRVERQKKRKAHDVLIRPAMRQKKRKLDPSAETTSNDIATPRPRKKSERVSWLPTPEEGPTRSSSRKQTVQNKKIIHSRMVASERRRIQQIQVMEAAAKRKEALKPKALNQAERMEEAARTERMNAKSLNRWEAAEKKRSEEQKAKLEALHSRQLSGPVESWWSGMAEWVSGKLRKIGWNNIRGAEERPPSRRNQGSTEDSVDRMSIEDHPTTAETQNSAVLDQPQDKAGLAAPRLLQEPHDHDGMSPQQVNLAPASGPHGLLDGIHYYASLPDNSKQDSPLIRENPAEDVQNRTGPNAAEPTSLVSRPKHVAPSQRQPHVPPPPPVVSERSSRNLVILEGFDTDVLRQPAFQSHVLLKKRVGKSQSKSLKDWNHINIFLD
ncbi:MAG: hypothetical protein LQ342_005116 [Letrouitia transgressa]|nr:MAG: hypothetical protein LQ342_005116 [Letrouitia transgressa]